MLLLYVDLLSKILSRWVQFALAVEASYVGELGLQFLKVPPGGSMNDHGLVPPDGLHFPHSVAKSLEPAPRLRRA